MAKRNSSKFRLLMVERMILTGQKLTVREIQQKLERRYDIWVDRKSIMDDLYTIDKIVPLEFMSGRNGGVRMLDMKTLYEEGRP